MWVSRDDWEQQKNMTIESSARAVVYSEQNKVHQVTMDWLRMRITQLEKERAQMFYQLSGVKIPVPEIVHAPAPTAVGENHPFNKLPSFEDMGDSEAKNMGISYNADGTVKYA